jgi:TonB-dependent receptor
MDKKLPLFRISLLGCIGAAGFISSNAFAQSADAAGAKEGEELDEVVVTGFRRSLADSTAAKKESVGFTDSIFAEDIGKFPDSNLAESFNRIPGITITRETSGEGLNIAIRGLGTNFTRVLLNDAPVAIASTGRTDSQNTNREVDLDMFPTELFSQLTVHKSSDAHTLEGGAAGTVNMRMARPFDKEGGRLAYSIQGIDNKDADGTGVKGSLVASDTWDSFGVLVGVSGYNNKVNTTGFETIGWTNANLSSSTAAAGSPARLNAQCRPAITPSDGFADTCNGTGGGNWTIPGTVPANANIPGVATGTPINRELLLQLNPGLTLQQIDNALIPRLGRPSAEFGTKNRYNGVISLEYRPTDSLHFFLDSMYGKKENDMQRIDMNLVGRNGAIIPMNMQVDNANCTTGCVVTSATFANAQYFLEYRPFVEDTDFWGTNPGMNWQIAEKWNLDVQGNYTKSTFHRESPTLLVITPASSGVTATYTNDGGIPDVLTSNVDLNNPANFVWNGGRVNMQDEKRETETKGGRANLTWGDDKLNVKFGGAYDDVSRAIIPYDNSGPWQNAICGGNPSSNVPGPNSQPPCNGLNTGYPAYPAYGTGYTAGFPALTRSGSLIPQTALANYLLPGPEGYITADWNAVVRDSNYNLFHDSTPDAGSSNTSATWGTIEEKVTGAFTEMNGQLDLGDNNLKYNVGVRYVQTDQIVGSRVSRTDPRNPAPPASGPNPADGSLYPNVVSYEVSKSDYNKVLPSANAALHLGENAIARAGISRTLTRPNPNALLPGLNFSSPSADVGSLGNSELDPYLSDNIDLGFEYYTGDEGYFGFAAFRKAITGFTVSKATTMPFSDLAQYGVTYATLTPTQQAAINARGGPAAATVTLNQQVNADGKLIVNGLEFNWVQPLDFGSTALQGLGLTANYTLIDQKGQGAAPAIATGVAPSTYNATLYYENHGVSARVSVTSAEGSQLTGPGGQNGITAAELYSDDYTQYDFSSSFDLSEMFDTHNWVPQLTLDVINLTNAEQRTYFQFSNATFTQYNAGRTIIVGLRGSF